MYSVFGVFDTIGIDSVEGLLNVDGYHCVLTIIDQASKLIMVEPIKSKSSDEAIGLLWRWICTYGPPKRIISYQGNLFLNEVVSA